MPASGHNDALIRAHEGRFESLESQLGDARQSFHQALLELKKDLKESITAVDEKVTALVRSSPRTIGNGNGQQKRKRLPLPLSFLGEWWWWALAALFLGPRAFEWVLHYLESLL